MISIYGKITMPTMFKITKKGILYEMCIRDRPIQALEARIASSKLNLNNLAHMKVTSIFISTTTKQNTNNNGEFIIIDCIEAGTPITTKNM